MRGRRGISEDKKQEMVKRLTDTFDSFKEIADDLGVSASLVAKVNQGMVKAYAKYYDGTFPIRFTTEERNELIGIKYSRGSSIEELAKEFHITIMIVVKVLKEQNLI